MIHDHVTHTKSPFLLLLHLHLLINAGEMVDHTDDALASLCKVLVPPTYIQQGIQALSKRHVLFRRLLEHRRMPEKAWDEASIEGLLHDLAMMDR